MEVKFGDIEVENIENAGEEAVTRTLAEVLFQLSENPDSYPDSHDKWSLVDDHANLVACNLSDDELRAAFKQLDEADIDALWTEVLACEVSFKAGVAAAVSIGIAAQVRDRLERLGIEAEM